MMKTISILIFIFVVFISSISAEQLYNVSYEGQFYDSLGNLDGNLHNVTFIWINSTNSVVMNKTFYNIDPDVNARFFQYLPTNYSCVDKIKAQFGIDGTNLTNTSQIGYVPYAINSIYLGGKNISYFENKFNLLSDDYFNKSRNETVTGVTTFDNDVIFNRINVTYINSNVTVVTAAEMTVNNTLCIDSVDGVCRVNLTADDVAGLVTTDNLTLSNVHNKTDQIRFYGNTNLTEFNITEVEYVNNMKWNVTYSGNEIVVETYYS